MTQHCCTSARFRPHRTTHPLPSERGCAAALPGTTPPAVPGASQTTAAHGMMRMHTLRNVCTAHTLHRHKNTGMRILRRQTHVSGQQAVPAQPAAEGMHATWSWRPPLQLHRQGQGRSTGHQASTAMMQYECASGLSANSLHIAGGAEAHCHTTPPRQRQASTAAAAAPRSANKQAA